MTDAQQHPTADEGLTVLLQLLAIPLFLVVLWAGMNLFADANNLVATGIVTAKQEKILFSGDEWHRDFEVSYRYQPSGVDSSETGSSSLSQNLYERLPLGASVRIHYSPFKLLRLVQGIGAYVEGTSWSSRLPGGAWQARDWGEGVAILGGLLLGWFAYRRRSVALGVCAVLAFGAAYPLILLIAGALLVFPFLFWAWHKHPGHGYGWMLLGGIAVSVALTYWRVPRPEPLPAGPSQTGTAVIRQVKTVKRIWSTGRSAPNRGGSVGQTLSHPFYMVDLEFTPLGSADPVHAVDKIDEVSASSMSKGQSVAIVYPITNPRQAQLVGATRAFSQPIFRELIWPTLIGTVLVTFVAIPVFNGFDCLFRRLFPFATRGEFNPAVMERMVSVMPVERVERELAKLPPADPRRLKLEAFLRQRRQESEKL